MAPFTLPEHSFSASRKSAACSGCSRDCAHDLNYGGLSFLRQDKQVEPAPDSAIHTRALSFSSSSDSRAGVSAEAARRYCAGQEILWPSWLAACSGQYG